MSTHNKQCGVAMIQVLLIVAMLLILVVQLSQQSRFQVKSAIDIQQRGEVVVSLQSAIEEAKFALITQPLDKPGATSLSSKWNFFGRPFTHEQLQVTLQDNAGLISLPYYSHMLPFIAGSGGGINASAAESVKNWQATGNSIEIPAGWRGGYVQYEQELNQIPGLSGSLDVSGFANVTHLPMRSFNPATAPDTLLVALAREGNEDALMELRQSKPFDVAAFNRLSRLPIEFDSAYPSDTITINAQKSLDNWTVNRSVTVVIDPAYISPVFTIGTPY